jgi:isocitrate dehydrogenase
MTKDLAICVHNTNDVPRNSWVTTEEYIHAVAKLLSENLKK